MMEPLQIPMLDGRIVIAVVALAHVLFATFIVGSSVIGSVTETIGVLSNNPRYDRLARLIAFTLIFTTAGVSFLGVILVFFLNIYWPRFWTTLFRIMFWPILLEAAFFLCEAIFAYAWYYTWDLGTNRRLHLVFGWLAAASSLLAMVMIDIVASFMLTPTSLEFAWDRIFNPTMMHLDLHRIFGNLTWTGFGLAAICALALRDGCPEEDRKFYRWSGSYCFMIGFAALLVMPVIGYQYLLQIRYAQPQAFQTLMLGERSWVFDLVALLYGSLILLGSLYTFQIVRANSGASETALAFMRISLVVTAMAAIILALPYHLRHIPFLRHLTTMELNPLGKMQPNKYFAIAFLITFGFMNWLYFMRSFWGTRLEEQTSKGGRSLLIALSGCAIVMMLVMGWTRETARATNGYLIYGKIKLSDEAPTYGSPASPRR
jgi:cytochrome d ubiquinol oxidase subunit I